MVPGGTYTAPISVGSGMVSISINIKLVSREISLYLIEG